MLMRSVLTCTCIHVHCMFIVCMHEYLLTADGANIAPIVIPLVLVPVLVLPVVALVIAAIVCYRRKYLCTCKLKQGTVHVSIGHNLTRTCTYTCTKYSLYLYTYSICVQCACRCVRVYWYVILRMNFILISLDPEANVSLRRIIDTSKTQGMDLIVKTTCSYYLLAKTL